MGFEWLGSLTSLVELIGSLIPRREQIPFTHRGVKYAGMKVVHVLGPGNYWVWPFRSMIKQFDIMSRPISLSSQYAMTRDGTTVWIDGAVLVSMADDDDSIVKAFVHNSDISETVAAESMNAICELLSETLWEELIDRSHFNAELTKLIRTKLRKYGVRVHRAYLATLASGRPLLILGNGS